MSGLSPAAYCFLVRVKTHEENNNMADQFKCPKCGKSFNSQSELTAHEKNCNKK
jgi:transposase-like protein